MDYRLEVPSVSDAARLGQLKADTFIETYAADNDPKEVATHVGRDFSVDAVAKQLADPNCDTSWILDGPDPVGYLKLNRGSAQTEPGLDAAIEIEQLYVRKSHQGRGLGGRLLDLAAETARREGRDFLWLSVWERNANAISLYRHRGFAVFDEHIFMFGDEAQRDLMMRLDL